jgi:hypothetical protein
MHALVDLVLGLGMDYIALFWMMRFQLKPGLQVQRSIG